MKLQERLPRHVTVAGRKYRANLDFRNVLRMMDVMARGDLIPGAKQYIALRCVMRRPPRDTAAAMNALRALLFPGAKKTADEKKLTDFVQDADLIRAAFLQAYGINLWRDKLHWMEFTALLSCLPQGSRYSDILGIRARPMPKATKYNAEERQWLMKAKAQCALHVPEEDRESNYLRCVQNVFAGLLAMAQKGGGDNG